MSSTYNTGTVYFNINATLWENTLPNIVQPFKGESLCGYLLRLDVANGFLPGTTIELIKNHNTGVSSLNRLGLFVIGKSFDLKKLSNLTNIPYDQILSLTFTQITKIFFNSDNINANMVGYSNEVKVCPTCIKQHRMPLIHMFNNIDICLEHNTMLIRKCICGHALVLFSSESDFFTCPHCHTPYYKLIPKASISKADYKKQEKYYEWYYSIIYKNVTLTSKGEDFKEGLENRLQSIAHNMKYSGNLFIKKFGKEIAMIKSGHGITNLSISKIVDCLYVLGHTPESFKNLELNSRFDKIPDIGSEETNMQPLHTCPNIYCKYYGQLNRGNIRNYGKRKLRSGKIVMEEYCVTCATRFIGDNIIQSYDYNPGVRWYKIEEARKKITVWQKALKKTCSEMIDKRIPITLTKSFKESGIPIGKTYFCDRLGLIDIILEYANIQIEDSKKWINELPPKEASNFLRKIYKKH